MYPNSKYDHICMYCSLEHVNRDGQRIPPEKSLFEGLMGRKEILTELTDTFLYFLYFPLNGKCTEFQMHYKIFSNHKSQFKTFSNFKMYSFKGLLFCLHSKYIFFVLFSSGTLSDIRLSKWLKQSIRIANTTWRKYIQLHILNTHLVQPFSEKYTQMYSFLREAGQNVRYKNFMYEI